MTDKNQQTFLWYDFETWGANPKKDHPSQFAAIRTDMDLNEIGTPMNWYCQIPNDCLPHPQACLITGITPQQSLRDGLLEMEFCHRILTAMSQPGTCSAGYNSIRFDDEVTRFMAYRNFHDPYAREWQNGNSRWDIIDLVRAAYALRPEGINWVYKEGGVPSFKLEQLSIANGITHLDAHDALSDVRATIGLAKVIKQAQPKLYDYVFSLRKKANVNEQIDTFNMKPLVHISSKIPAANGCCTWIAPIAQHPSNNNATICVNLAMSPEPLFELSAQAISERMYTPAKALNDTEAPIPLKLIQSNKCPVIAPAKSLTPENAERLGIDREACHKHLKMLQGHKGIQQKLIEVFEMEKEFPPEKAEFSLYSGGFFSSADKAQIDSVRHSQKDKLADYVGKFSDPRLERLLFLYRGRNFPETFTFEEMEHWKRHRQGRLTDADSGSSIQLEQYMFELETLINEYQQEPSKLRIIKDLYRYAEQL
ncbi:exodeoxyribonuclease I [Alteromonas sp. a30]|uniref:exodeoxyribonuclease I n=1 Tax=Alteromonas sp. a30 TaxID=2730917 RepID=UPI00227ED176|nr:exodeoxyribonuclease I [Alteromonas sp. a30]MCY7296390.1 exodeoxyribonuclease I [Alteromonas sp. a30]